MLHRASGLQRDAQKTLLVERLEEMRQRTLSLIDGLSDADLAKIHDVAVGPVNWDLGHIAAFEESWLIHGVEGAVEWESHYDPTYDADKAPRPHRDRLGLPSRAALVGKLEESRARVLEKLQGLDLAAGNAYVHDGFVHEMVVQHEAQHQENMLVAMQAIPGRFDPPRRAPKPTPHSQPSGLVLVPAGPALIGADQGAGIYDNEGPQRLVDVPAFRIGAAPVTNGEYLRFIEDGGYERPQLWSEDGWYMRTVHAWGAPKYWKKDDAGRWTTREYARTIPLPPNQPVVHVSWYEAEAYASWARKRLPTEIEWEKAATWDPATGTRRRYPWGDSAWTPERANLDQSLYGVAPVGAYPEGVSAYGCHQMMGDAWEWTASDFKPYPGYRAFPYEGYSTPFLDRGFRSLRGGSWATRPHVARGTFRNWHHPYHQHVFAGFRLAEDA